MRPGFIPSHGGYKQLLSYQKAEIVYDATVYFCDRFVDRHSRTRDQMVQAATSPGPASRSCSRTIAIFSVCGDCRSGHWITPARFACES